MANRLKIRKAHRCRFEPGETYETSPELAKIHEDIRSFYFSGVQLFTKDSLRAVGRQLRERNEKTDKIYVKAINGDLVDFPVRSGSVISSPIYKETV
jgi:hypothetical protein